MKKIAFIGAGSLQFTSSCVRDLLTFPAFEECEFALMDINPQNLANIEKIVKTIIEKMNKPKCKVSIPIVPKLFAVRTEFFARFLTETSTFGNTTL